MSKSAVLFFSHSVCKTSFCNMFLLFNHLAFEWTFLNNTNFIHWQQIHNKICSISHFYRHVFSLRFNNSERWILKRFNSHSPSILRSIIYTKSKVVCQQLYVCVYMLISTNVVVKNKKTVSKKGSFLIFNNQLLFFRHITFTKQHLKLFELNSLNFFFWKHLNFEDE